MSSSAASSTVVSTARVTDGLAALAGAAIIAIGARFLLDPQPAAVGFGVPSPSAADAYLAVKGVRDIASGLFVLILLSLGQRRALGWVLLAAAIIPAADAAIVVAHGGPPAVAYGVHGATAALLVAVAGLLLRGERRPTRT